MKIWLLLLALIFAAAIIDVQSKNEDLDAADILDDDMIEIKLNDNDEDYKDEDDDEDTYEQDEYTSMKRDPWGVRIPPIRFPPVRIPPIIFHQRRRCAHVRRPTCQTTSNGCGPALTQSRFGHVNYVNKQVLTSSCNKHDNCYSCHNELNWNRAACDLRFKHDMESRCNCHFNQFHQQAARSICLAQANIMYTAVFFGGGAFITRGYDQFCYNDCTVPIASPYIPIDH